MVAGVEGGGGGGGGCHLRDGHHDELGVDALARVAAHREHELPEPAQDPHDDRHHLDHHQRLVRPIEVHRAHREERQRSGNDDDAAGAPSASVATRTSAYSSSRTGA